MVLNPVISKLTSKLVVLASSSPRRMEILRNAVWYLPVNHRHYSLYIIMKVHIEMKQSLSFLVSDSPVMDHQS